MVDTDSALVDGADPTGQQNPAPGDAPTDTGGLAGPRQLRRLLDAVMSVSSDLQLSAVLERIADAATDLAGATYGALGVLDESRTMLSEFIAVGIDEESRAAIGALPSGHGILGQLIVDPRPLRLPDLTEHPDSCGFPPHHPPMTSFLGVPLLIRGEAFGNLYLCDKVDGGVFTDIDQELVIALAAAAAVAIQNARLHARVADVTLIEDRDRIARDLHDTVVQRLFAIGLGLEGAARLAQEPAAVERIQTAIDDLDTTIKEIRSAIFELHSTRPTGESTRQAVMELAAESARNLGFEPAVHFTGPIDTAVVGEVAEHLLAVQREALANAAKHAGATVIDLRISAGSGQLVLEVADDGSGLEPVRVPEPGGRGLSNMRTRARRLGGDCTLENRSGGGAVLRWTVPLR